MMHRTYIAALVTAAALVAAPAAFAATTDISGAVSAAVADPGRPDADRMRDSARHPAEMLTFAEIKPGAKVVDLIPGGGYFTRVFSKTVGPDGKVYAFIPAAMPDRMAAALDPVAKDPAYGNVVVLRQPSADFAPPESVDVVWTAQNYHDLHNNGGNPAALNLAIYQALKPGGVYVVIDHVAKSGTGVSDTSTLHRIDPAVVKAEVTKAGFKFDGESTVLRRTDDPHTVKVFEMHDQTDQFAYRFKKPK